MTLKNYLLPFLFITALVFTSCKKDDDELTGADAPTIEINGVTAGNIIEVPAAAQSANNGQFNSVVSNINQIGLILQQLNNIPANATGTSTSNKSTNSSVTYYWSDSNDYGVFEVWYTVEENGANYNLTYEIAIETADITIPRTKYMDGWVSQDGQNGNIVFYFEAFTNGETDFNYTYEWNTNTAGDFNVLAYWNIDSMYSQMEYEATVYADGSGFSEYRYSFGTDSYIQHYEWNSSWTEVTWSYSVNGVIDPSNSGVWTP